jgi:NAD(P)-dependent dehydrogenase (short-subunit alcohol dehydrogenase family)
LSPSSDTAGRKTVLVTGGTSGLGLETSRALARDGATVVLTGRDPARCAAAAGELPGAEWIAADFGDLAQVAALADEVRRRHDRLDVLVNNAGAVFQRRRVTADGLELTFVVNHLAAFLLTTRLLDLLEAGAPSRIVNVASVAHSMEHLDFDDLQLTRGYRPFRAYGRSKLANVMFTYELARRLAGTGVTANAVHPGLVRTAIGSKGGRLTGVGWSLAQLRYRNAVIEPAEGARAIVRLAASPAMESVTGAYFDRETEVESSAESRDPAACARLWEVSERLVGGVSSSGTASG